MSTILFRSVDLETSKKDEGEVVEIGWTDIWFNTETRCSVITPPKSLLFRPLHGMDPGAQGTHHISMARVRDLPPCTEADLAAVAMDGAPQFLIAHNLSYEEKFFTRDLLDAAGCEAKWICTFKGALRAWEEAPEHGLQALRYWRGLELEEAMALPAHRAGPDSYVGAHIFAELAKTERVAHLELWTREPRHYPVCPLHKHKGQKWHYVPHSYLKWMVGNGNDLEFDLKHAAQSELNRRAEQGAGT